MEWFVYSLLSVLKHKIMSKQITSYIPWFIYLLIYLLILVIHFFLIVLPQRRFWSLPWNNMWFFSSRIYRVAQIAEYDYCLFFALKLVLDFRSISKEIWLSIIIIWNLSIDIQNAWMKHVRKVKPVLGKMATERRGSVSYNT